MLGRLDAVLFQPHMIMHIELADLYSIRNKMVTCKDLLDTIFFEAIIKRNVHELKDVQLKLNNLVHNIDVFESVIINKEGVLFEYTDYGPISLN